MFLKKKKNIVSLIDTICNSIEYINNFSKFEMLEDVEIAIKSILDIVSEEKYNIEETINYINISLETVKRLIKKGDEVNFDDLDELLGQVSVFEQAFLIQVQVKLNIVFMPYNITMWDSLESIYLACEKDDDCVARIVPIPFFDITQNPPILNYHFDQYDKSLNLVRFDEFDLASEQPDVIYIHNAYDNGNILTSVLPEYYTSNLKKYTDMLVFSPYSIVTFTKIKNKIRITRDMSYTFNGIGTNNIDRFICAGDFVKEEGLKFGFSKEKLLNLGTPKFDYLIKNIEKDFDYPKKWIENKDKRIVVFNTSVNYFVNQLVKELDRFTNACNVIQEFTRILTIYKENDIFVIWRPHPLTNTFIKRVNPELSFWYENLCKDIVNPYSMFSKQYSNVYLDTSKSCLPAFKISDALLTGHSSLIYSYLMLNKKLLYLSGGGHFRNQINNIDPDKIEFLLDLDSELSYLDKICNFSKKDSFKIDNCLINKFYKNLDGTVGEKVHNTIKNDILNN